MTYKKRKVLGFNAHIYININFKSALLNYKALTLFSCSDDLWAADVMTT